MVELAKKVCQLELFTPLSNAQLGKSFTLPLSQKTNHDNHSVSFIM